MDEDVSVDKALNYPDLYKSLQKGRELNLKTFLGWLWKSIYQVKSSWFVLLKFSQGAMIMILSTLLFDNSFLNIVTITFTALIVAELLNVSSEVMINFNFCSIFTTLLRCFEKNGLFFCIFLRCFDLNL